MALNRIPVDQTKFNFCRLVGVSPKVRDGEQAVNRDGVPLFTANVLFETNNDDGSVGQELIKVTVPTDGKKAPGEGIPVFSEVRFENLTAGAYTTNGDRTAFFFSADYLSATSGASKPQS